MKKEFDHIDELFQNSLKNFEGDVGPDLWNNIQSSINTTSSIPDPSSTAKTVASSTTKATIIKSAIALASIVGIGTVAYQISNSENSDNVTVSESIINEEITNSEENQINIANADNKFETSALETPNTKANNSETESSAKNSIKNVASTSNEKSPIMTDIKEENTETANSENGTTITEPKTSNPTNNNSSINKPKKEKLNATISSNVRKGQAPLDVEFNVEGNAVNYVWDFGDGSESSNLRTPFHTYKKPGKYFVSLTIIDKEANSKIINYTIEVEKVKNSSIKEVQNVFSPNGDGINDVIKIDGENIKDFTAIVRDFKGNLVFEWNNIDGFWDGKDLNDNKLPKGTYYMVVNAVGNDGEKHLIQKRIQLF